MVQTVLKTVAFCSDAGREKGRIFRHFWIFCGDFFGALNGTQFLLCVVEGRWVALTPGVELLGVEPSKLPICSPQWSVVFR